LLPHLFALSWTFVLVSSAFLSFFRMFIDSHCHLNFPQLLPELATIRAEMAQAKVQAALCISTMLEEFDQVHALALQYDNFWATVGVHPDNEDVQEPTLEGLLQQARLPRVVGIGETGLDYFRLESQGRTVADMGWQRQRFRTHIQAAVATQRPLVIHTRGASEDTLRILKEEGAQRVGGVLHCFTESWEVAKAALDMGFFISFSGILTFKNATDLHEVARKVPLAQCLIETDSPYLAPVPHRGKVNNPALVPHVAQRLAELKKISVEEVGNVTTENFFRCFPLTQEGRQRLE
jgi:TatD DNase family protein